MQTPSLARAAVHHVCEHQKPLSVVCGTKCTCPGSWLSSFNAQLSYSCVECYIIIIIIIINIIIIIVVVIVIIIIIVIIVIVIVMVMVVIVIVIIIIIINNSNNINNVNPKTLDPKLLKQIDFNGGADLMIP